MSQCSSALRLYSKLVSKHRIQSLDSKLGFKAQIQRPDSKTRFKDQIKFHQVVNLPRLHPVVLLLLVSQLEPQLQELLLQHHHLRYEY